MCIAQSMPPTHLLLILTCVLDEGLGQSQKVTSFSYRYMQALGAAVSSFVHIFSCTCARCSVGGGIVCARILGT